MALTGGTMQLTAGVRITGVTQNPQGTGSTAGIPDPTWSGGGNDNQVLSFGTATGLADIYCCAAWDIAASTALTLDVYTGTDFKDVLGGTAAFRKLKAIYVQIVNGTGDTSGVTIGNAASNANILWFGNVNDTWTIFDGGPPFIGGNTSGVTVDATHKNLKFANNSTTTLATVVIALVGSSV